MKSVLQQANAKNKDLWAQSLSDKLSLYLSFPFLYNYEFHRNAFLTCLKKEDHSVQKENILTKGHEKY